MPSRTSTSFTEQFEELERLLEELEHEEDLDRAMKKFERGIVLAKELKKRLTGVENRIEAMKKDVEHLDDA